MPEEKKNNVIMYEKRLNAVMNALGVDNFDFDYTRLASWVTFSHQGHSYRFDYSVEEARKHGHSLAFGSDTFCQIVQVLEELAQLSGNGIKDLQQWIEGGNTQPEMLSCNF